MRINVRNVAGFLDTVVEIAIGKNVIGRRNGIVAVLSDYHVAADSPLKIIVPGIDGRKDLVGRATDLVFAGVSVIRGRGLSVTVIHIRTVAGTAADILGVVRIAPVIS